MTNHVHLLITLTSVGALSGVMQALGRHYVRYINDTYGEHPLRSYRYIELNPIRAGMVATADQYRWSSHAGNVSGSPDPLAHAHDCYLRLATKCGRATAGSANWCNSPAPQDASCFSHYLHHQHRMGNGRFRAAIEAKAEKTAPKNTSRGVAQMKKWQRL